MAFLMVKGASVMIYIGEGLCRLRNKMQFTVAVVQRCSVKKNVLKNFANLTGKQLRCCLF